MIDNSFTIEDQTLAEEIQEYFETKNKGYF